MIALQFSQFETTTAKGLCIEFILHEYAKALSLVKNLSSVCAADTPAIIDKLFYNPIDVEHPYRLGVIDKLCFYCEALVQTSKTGEAILGAIDEVRNCTAKSRNALLRQQRSLCSSESFSLSELVQSLKQSLHAFFQVLVPIFTSCQECETALFALLEVRKTINEHLGQNSVENIFQQIFPGGPQLLRQALDCGYSRRGFNDFCQRHEELFEGLVWPYPQEICNQRH